MSLEVALVLFEYVVLLLAISIHDAAQSWVAARLGDPTPRMLGRLTINPAKHFDLFGTVIWPVVFTFLFHSTLMLGWGKPLPITSRNFRRAKDEMLVYLSGPVAHLAAAALCLVILIILKHAVPGTPESLGIAVLVTRHNPFVSTLGLPAVFPVLLFLYYGILVNLLLFAFNLVPLPSLDGGKVLRYYLPYNAQRTYDNIGLYLMIAFFLFGYRLIDAIFLPVLGLFNGLLASL